jgi:hypothetical protein
MTDNQYRIYVFYTHIDVAIVLPLTVVYSPQPPKKKTTCVSTISCLLMDRDKMSNLYRGHAIDASYQV